MKFVENGIFHIYNQGNNRQRVFFTPENYLFFLRKMREYLLPHGDLLCYCLMPNHFHWLFHVRRVEVEVSEGVTQSHALTNASKSILSQGQLSSNSNEGALSRADLGSNSKGMTLSRADLGSNSKGMTLSRADLSSNSKGMTLSGADLGSNSKGMTLSHTLTKARSLNDSIGLLLRSYTRAINKQENRNGSLFRKETKAKDGWQDPFITAQHPDFGKLWKDWQIYGTTCYHYIHNNPVRAGLVSMPEKWDFSSAKDFAGLRNGSLCNYGLAKELLYLP